MERRGTGASDFSGSRYTARIGVLNVAKAGMIL